MSDYSRPNEEGKPKETVTFWANLWRPMEDNTHGEALEPVKFGTEPECVTWVRAHRANFEQVTMWKRISREGGSFEDIPLRADVDEPPTVQGKERLKALVINLKKMLDDKKRELDRHAKARPYSRVSEFNPIERPLTYDEVYGEKPEAPT